LKKAAILFGLLFLINVAELTAQQRSDAALQTRIETTVRRAMEQRHITGLAVGVIKNGRVIYSKGFGVYKLGGQKPITTRSIFHMASVTKLFTATAVMQLAARGKLNLNAHITDYLPYFHLRDERYKSITVRQMLRHTSGMPDVDDYGWDRPEYDAGALERYVRSLMNLPMNAAPGQRFEYSNIAFDVLGDLVAKVSGESYEDYVRRYILAPLRMMHSTLLLREVDAGQLTTPHVSDQQGNITVSEVFPYSRIHAPSSTLYSNVEEMNRFALANLNLGQLGGRRILKASSYEQMWRLPAGVENSEEFPFGKVGLGWFVYKYRGHRFVGHAGADIGFNTFLLLAPDERSGVVVMGNLYPGQENYLPTGTFYTANIARDVMDLILH